MTAKLEAKEAQLRQKPVRKTEDDRQRKRVFRRGVGHKKVTSSKVMATLNHSNTALAQVLSQRRVHKIPAVQAGYDVILVDSRETIIIQCTSCYKLLSTRDDDVTDHVLSCAARPDLDKRPEVEFQQTSQHVNHVNALLDALMNSKRLNQLFASAPPPAVDPIYIDLPDSDNDDAETVAASESESSPDKPCSSRVTSSTAASASDDLLQTAPPNREVFSCANETSSRLDIKAAQSGISSGQMHIRDLTLEGTYRENPIRNSTEMQLLANSLDMTLEEVTAWWVARQQREANATFTVAQQRPKRTYLTEQQRQMLNVYFEANPNPHKNERDEIVMKTGLSHNRVIQFFAYQRRKKRLQLGQQIDYKKQTPVEKTKRIQHKQQTSIAPAHPLSPSDAVNSSMSDVRQRIQQLLDRKNSLTDDDLLALNTGCSLPDLRSHVVALSLERKMTDAQLRELNAMLLYEPQPTQANLESAATRTCLSLELLERWVQVRLSLMQSEQSVAVSPRSVQGQSSVTMSVAPKEVSSPTESTTMNSFVSPSSPHHSPQQKQAQEPANSELVLVQPDPHTTHLLETLIGDVTGGTRADLSQYQQHQILQQQRCQQQQLAQQQHQQQFAQQLAQQQQQQQLAQQQHQQQLAQQQHQQQFAQQQQQQQLAQQQQQQFAQQQQQQFAQQQQQHQAAQRQKAMRDQNPVEQQQQQVRHSLQHRVREQQWRQQQSRFPAQCRPPLQVPQEQQRRRQPNPAPRSSMDQQIHQQYRAPIVMSSEAVRQQWGAERWKSYDPEVEQRMRQHLPPQQQPLPNLPQQQRSLQNLPQQQQRQRIQNTPSNSQQLETWRQQQSELLHKPHTQQQKMLLQEANRQRHSSSASNSQESSSLQIVPLHTISPISCTSTSSHCITDSPEVKRQDTPTPSQSVPMPSQNVTMPSQSVPMTSQSVPMTSQSVPMTSQSVPQMLPSPDSSTPAPPPPPSQNVATSPQQDEPASPVKIATDDASTDLEAFLSSEDYYAELLRRRFAYSCPACNMFYMNAKCFLEHQEIHGQKSDFHCAKCDESFPIAYSFLGHFIFNHERITSICID